MTGTAIRLLTTATLTVFLSGLAYAQTQQLTGAEIRQLIVGKCWSADVGRMQLFPNGKISFQSKIPRYSYDGTYVIQGNSIKSNQGRITRFYKAENRFYSRNHGASSMSRLRRC